MTKIPLCLEEQAVLDAFGVTIPRLRKWDDPDALTGYQARNGHVIKLRVRGQNLTNMPESIGILQNLEELDISNNYIWKLPLTVGNLQALHTMNLIKKPSMLCLTAIERHVLLECLLFDIIVDIYKNRIDRIIINLDATVIPRHIPESIGNLIELQCLNLSNANLFSVPDWLKKLINLDSLYLSHNHLTELPDWVQNFEKLEWLDLSDNSFVSLPDWFDKFKHLTRLNLAKNPGLCSPWKYYNRDLKDSDLRGFQNTCEWMRNWRPETLLKQLAANLDPDEWDPYHSRFMPLLMYLQEQIQKRQLHTPAAIRFLTLIEKSLKIETNSNPFALIK